MNIVVLDGYTLNPGDLSWAALETLGHCTVYDRTSPDDMISRARDAHLIITNKACLNREIIQALPKLQYIGVTATGYYRKCRSLLKRQTAERGKWLGHPNNPVTDNTHFHK